MKGKHNQAWLFAFTDLAFLLLLSLSLIPSAPNNITIHFSEMDIPVVPSNPNMSPIEQSRDIWELQVYAKSKDHPTPFKLVKIGIRQRRAKELYSKNLDRNNLIYELKLLKDSNIRPVLLPEKTSLSQDFLFGAGTIARVWGSGESQTIVKSIDSEGFQWE